MPRVRGLVVIAGILVLAAHMASAADETMRSAPKQVAEVTKAPRTEVLTTVSTVASDEPRRLSDLAGDDQRAWRSANSVHPRLFARRAHP